MTQQFSMSLSEIIIAVCACTGLFVVMTASIYDLHAVASRRYFKKLIASLRKSRQPHITILVYAKNNADTLAVCLRSIERSHYHYYDVVVVDNVSSDATRQVVAEYRRRHVTSSFYYYQKRKISGQLEALRQGLRKGKNAEFVLVLAADATIAPTLLKASVARCVSDSHVGALRLNERSEDVANITLLVPSFLRLSRSMYEKCANVLSFGSVWIGKTGVLYQASIFKGRHKQSRVFCSYASGLIVNVPARYRMSVRTNRVLERLPVLLVLVLAIYLMTYFMYRASMQNSSLLVLSWIVVSLWFIAAAWSDEAARLSNKVARTFSIPILYFLLYLQLIVDTAIMCGQMMWRVGRAVRYFRQN